MVLLLSTAFFGDKTCTRLMHRCRVEKKSVVAVVVGDIEAGVAAANMETIEKMSQLTIPAVGTGKVFGDAVVENVATIADTLIRVGARSFRTVRKASRRSAVSKAPSLSGVSAAASTPASAGSAVSTARKSRLSSSGATPLPDVPVLIERTPTGERRRRMSIKLNGGLAAAAGCVVGTAVPAKCPVLFFDGVRPR